jgi:hypothetical protein
VERTIGTIQKSWSQPGARQDPNAPGWDALFGALLDDLRAYSQAETAADRLAPLNRIYQVSQALAAVPWVPAAELREELREWLRPRVRLAWSERRLDETVRNLPPTENASVRANRERWVDFMENDLGKALAGYNRATTVAQRQDSLKAVRAALTSLRTSSTQNPWQPSAELLTAVNDLFNQPNLDITADVSVVGPVFDQNLVTSGPVYRKGYWSQVTAGPKTGFGLLPSDDGIAFFNSQLYTSVTPIHDFQQQIERDRQGQRAAQLYAFSATSFDSAQLTMYSVLRPTGLSLAPAYNHSIDAQICSVPQASGGMKRAIAALIGMNQNAINRRVYEGAIGDFRQRIPQEALEEAQERIARELVQRNAEISRYLIGDNMLSIQDFLVTGLSLRSRPEAVYVGGLLQPRSGGSPSGADAPQPAALAVPSPGLSADVHLISVLNSVVDGLFQREEVKSVQNLMILTKDVPAGTPPKDSVTISKNVDFATYAKAVDDARKANKPKVTALRFFRPAQPPEFGVDARGFLVALVHNIVLEVPAPDKNTRVGSMIGVPARILRLTLPQAEIALSYQTEAKGPGAERIKARIEDFSPSPASQVLAINDDEKKPTPLTRFSAALVISSVVARLRSQPIEADLNRLNLRGFGIQSVTPLDPSGWMRVTLARVPEQVQESVQPKVETPPVAGPRAGPVSMVPTPDNATP